MVYNTTGAMEYVRAPYSGIEPTNLTVLLHTVADSEMVTETTAPSQFLPRLYFWVFGVVLCALSTVGVTTNVINIYALTLTVRTNSRPMYHCLICMAAVDLMVSKT